MAELLLLLLYALQGPVALAQLVTVCQPPVIFAAPGSPVTFLCSYTISGGQEATIGSYKWYKDAPPTGTELTNSHAEFSGRVFRTDTERFIRSRSAAIVLQNVQFQDCGFYYCEVTFQLSNKRSAHGNGTYLNVTGSAEGFGVDPSSGFCRGAGRLNPGGGACLLLKGLGLAAILLLALILYLWRRIGSRRRPPLDRRGTSAL